MKKLLLFLILFAPAFAHAQFAAVSRGPLSGNCSAHTLGIDAVNNNVYSCDGTPAQWQLVGGNSGVVSNCTTANAVAYYLNPGTSVGCNPAVLVGTGENSIGMPDNVSVANAPAGGWKLASIGGVPSIGFNGPLSQIETAANVGVPNGIAGLNSSAVLPIAEVVNSITNCDGSHAILGNQNCGWTLGLLEVNGTGLSAGDTVNLNGATPAAPTNGLNTACASSKSGTTDSVSCAIVGDGNAAHFLNGTGAFTSPSASAGSGLLNSSGPQSAITGTSSAANVYSYAIPGNTMNSTSCIRAFVGYQHTTGTAAVTYTWSFGGTTFASSGLTGTTAAQNSILICNNSATNSQYVTAFISYISGTSTQVAVFGTASIDTTTSQTIAFEFTVASTDKVTPEMWVVENVHP